jgi:hypothetical protein
MTYDFIFEFAGADEASARALTSLYRWLREDPTVHGETRIALVSDIEPERMGAAELLSAAVSQLTAIGSLAVSYANWRDARTAALPVHIHLGARTIEFTDASAEELAAALRALAAQPPAPPKPVPSATTSES